MTAMLRTASLSDDGRYRYTLTRSWGGELDELQTFVMLNPSTADAEVDDPTIRRCVGFARALGASGILVVNLYAFRATRPADLWRAADPVGPHNDAVLTSVLSGRGRPVIAAWGANARPDRVDRFLQLARNAGGRRPVTALGVTKAGAPRHPLYLPASARPVPLNLDTQETR
jgi:hypothetical protein